MTTNQLTIGQVQINDIVQGSINISGTSRNIRNEREQQLREAYQHNIYVLNSDSNEVKQFTRNQSISGKTFNWSASFTLDELKVYAPQLASQVIMQADVLVLTINQDGSSTLYMARTGAKKKSYLLNISTQQFTIFTA